MQDMVPIDLWIVEDDANFRRPLKLILENEDGMTCSHVFPSCIEMLEAIKTAPKPDLLLMDLGLPEMSGIEGIKRLAAIAPDITVIVLTVFKDKEKVLAALDAGAAGYLLKTAPPQEIVQGIRQVFFGEAALSPTIAKIVLSELRKPKPNKRFNLSDREIEVLELLAEDLCVKEVAALLHITHRTASFHLSNIYSKLEVQSQSGAIAKALRSGLI